MTHRSAGQADRDHRRRRLHRPQPRARAAYGAARTSRSSTASQVNNLSSFCDAGRERRTAISICGWSTSGSTCCARRTSSCIVQDARDYHALCRDPCQIQAAGRSCISRRSRTPTGRTRIRTAPSTTACARSRTRSTTCARRQVEHFIFFSSSMVYGNFRRRRRRPRTASANPIGIYGALKFAGEKIVIAYNQVFDLPYTIVRPSALYGPRCVSRRVGQIFIENALRGQSRCDRRRRRRPARLHLHRRPGAGRLPRRSTAGRRATRSST